MENVWIDRDELSMIQERQKAVECDVTTLDSDFIGFELEPMAMTMTMEKESENFSLNEKSYEKRARGITSVLRYNVPWANQSRRYGFLPVLPAEFLHQEIVDFVNYVSPTEEERFARSEAIRRLEAVVKNIWSEADVQTFGSFDSQLFLPTSDLDVVVLYEEPESDEHSKSPLNKLAKALLKAKIPVPESVKIITKARVPIIKYTDYQTDFEIDVAFNVTSGLEASQFMRKEMTAQPAVRSLTLILKHFLGMRALNEVYYGGIGSYAIMCLVISFLQFHPLVQSGLIRPHENLGVLLMELFELYGRNFNSEVVGISVTNGGSYIVKEEWGWFRETKPQLLSIVDPQNGENDISKGSFAYAAVRQSFEHAFNVLKCAINEFETKQEGHRQDPTIRHIPSMLGSIITLDHKLLRHRYYIQQTANL